MPKTKKKFTKLLNFRASDQLLSGIQQVDRESSHGIRVMLSEYLPIKLKMIDPISLPRTIKREDDTIGISATPENGLCLTFNDQPFNLNSENVDVLISNLMLYKISLTK